MKALLGFIAVGFISFVGLSLTKKTEIEDYSLLAASQKEDRQILTEHNESYKKTSADLLDTLLRIGDSNSTPIVEVQYVKDIIREHIEVHDTIKIPVYFKNVYTIYSARGAHVECDTCPCTNYSY